MVSRWNVLPESEADNGAHHEYLIWGTFLFSDKCLSESLPLIDIKNTIEYFLLWAMCNQGSQDSTIAYSVFLKSATPLITHCIVCKKKCTFYFQNCFSTIRHLIVRVMALIVHVLPAWVPFRYTGYWLWVAVLCLCGLVMNWWLVCGVTPPLPHDPERRRRNERKWME